MACFVSAFINAVGAMLCKSQHKVERYRGLGLVDHSQKMMMAARAMAEKKAFGHRS